MKLETTDLLPVEWGDSWRGAPTPRTDELIRIIRQRTRRQGLQLLIEVGGAISGMAFLMRFAGANLHPADRPFAVLYAVAIAVLGWFAVYNSRDTWQPQDETPLAHARLHVLRAERRVRSSHAAYAFLGLSALLYTPWILSRVESPAWPGAFAFLALIVGLFVFALRRTLRRASTERTAWSDVCAQLEE